MHLLIHCVVKAICAKRAEDPVTPKRNEVLFVKKMLCPEKISIPNCITTVRIVGTVFLLFAAPLSVFFFVIYILCGLSDVLDGWVARTTNNSTEFGARLDSIADLLFYLVMLIKLLPVLWRLFPAWLWYTVGAVLMLRLASYITAAVKFKRFASVHTRLNKLTGAAVFLIPFFIMLSCTVPYCFGVCVLAGIASAQELLLHICRNEYRTNKKALF